ncbi:MAG: TetR/AcrR family transcriptional regulator [Eggerthellaceae bacterium]|nr:TetR/AcrR family transcriptional regulator [Eggerthellaceae bacterium]
MTATLEHITTCDCETGAASAASQDPRIARTQLALREAFVSLLEEKGFEGITVGELCARANINRGTFYNHFRDKETMLHTYEDEILADLNRFQKAITGVGLRELVRFRIAKRPLPFLVELFDYLREQGSFLHAVLGPKGDASFGPKLRDAVCSKLIMSVLNEHYQNNPTPFVNYYVAFYASAYLGVITRWIETGMQESSEEMARIAMRLLFINPGEAITL